MRLCNALHRSEHNLSTVRYCKKKHEKVLLLFLAKSAQVDFFFHLEFRFANFFLSIQTLNFKTIIRSARVQSATLYIQIQSWLGNFIALYYNFYIHTQINGASYGIGNAYTRSWHGWGMLMIITWQSNDSSASTSY